MKTKKSLLRDLYPEEKDKKNPRKEINDYMRVYMQKKREIEKEKKERDNDYLKSLLIKDLKEIGIQDVDEENLNKLNNKLNYENESTKHFLKENERWKLVEIRGSFLTNHFHLCKIVTLNKEEKLMKVLKDAINCMNGDINPSTEWTRIINEGNELLK